MDVQYTVQNIILIILMFLTNVASNILTGEATNLLSSLTDPRDYAPYVIVFVFFIIQAFDAKYLSLFAQTIMYSIFNKEKGQRVRDRIILIPYTFFSVL